MEWIIILRSLIELIAQLQFSSAVGQSDGIASVQSGSRLPICLFYSKSSALGALIEISRPHGTVTNANLLSQLALGNVALLNRMEIRMVLRRHMTTSM